MPHHTRQSALTDRRRFALIVQLCATGDEVSLSPQATDGVGYHANVDLRLVLGMVLCCACSARLGLAPDGGGSGSGPGDGQTGGGDAPLGAWAPPAQIPGASDATNAEDDCTVNSTATELIYAVQPPAGNKDLYVITRPTTADPWSAPQALAMFNTTGTEESPRLSPDDKTLFFGRDGDIYSSTRATVGGAWSAPLAVASVNTAAYEKWLAVCNNGVVMVSRDNGAANGQDLFEGTLTAGATTIDTTLNSVKNEISTFLSVDCLTVYFASNRSGNTQIYTATRPSVAGAWSTPTMVPSPFSDGTDDEDPWISTDQRTFVFAGVRAPATTKDLYITTR